jgi:integrase
MTFGNFPDLPPAKARSIAADLSAKVRLGADPAGDKRVNRSEARHSFGRLVSGYLEFKKGELRDSSYGEVERYLDRVAKPLHSLPATAVDLRKIADLLDTIAKERGSISANRARTCLSAMFSWAMRKGLHDQNPVANTEARKEQTRHRVLTDSELAAVWNTVGNGDYGSIVRLLILTGQRANEIAGLGGRKSTSIRRLFPCPLTGPKMAGHMKFRCPVPPWKF